MYRSKTVFVIGAGASAEVGLPVGSQLKDQIVARLKVKEDELGRFVPANDQVWEAFRQYSLEHKTDVKALIGVCKEICKALPLGPSIDVILQSRDHEESFALCAKVAISHSILEGERRSAIAHRGNDRPDIFKDSVLKTWYNKLGASLADSAVKGLNLEGIFSNVTFIIFNYDRCVEHYLYWHLRLYFGIGDEDVASILSKATFHHPYGTVGRLPWQSGADEAVPFGADLNRYQLLNVRKGLRTFSERIEDDAPMLSWQKKLREAYKVIFLGFSFIEQNMKLLQCVEMSDVEHVYATGYLLSESNRDQANLDIRSALQPRLTLNAERVLIKHQKCTELFDEYSLSLTR